MKRINFLFISLVVVLLTVFSCKEEVIDPILDLSQKEIKLDKTGSVVTIDVTTNQDNWIATSPAEGDWLFLEQHESTLSVKATENEFGRTRSTYILVQAGMMFEKITLSQLEADVVLDVSPDEINFANSGGVRSVDIRTNTSTWELEKEDANIEWLEIRTFKNFAEIAVTPNAEKDVRTTKLFARSGSVIKEITVNQVGIGNARFMLPYFEIAPTHFEIIDYEKSRGNIFMSYREPGSFMGYTYPGEYNFAYASPIFDHFVTYCILPGSHSVDTIKMKSSNGADELLSKDYKVFLEKNGFKNIIVNEKNRTLTANARLESTIVKLDLTTEGDIANLYFTLMALQDKEYPTFKEFPYDKSDRIDKKEWTKEAIKAAEIDDGSTVVDDGDALWVTLDKKFHPTHTRVYFLRGKTNTDLSDQIMTVWNEPSLGVREISEGRSMLTDEFIALMKAEGFEEIGKATSGDALYGKRETGLLVVPRGVRYSNVLDGQFVFSIHYWYDDPGNFPALNSRSSSKREIINNISAELKEIDKKLGRY